MHMVLQYSMLKINSSNGVKHEWFVVVYGVKCNEN